MGEQCEDTIGTPQALAALRLTVQTAIVEAEDPKPSTRRGRQAGSTNWSRERFWRKYAEAARGLEPPYLPTHLAALMLLNYATFNKYLALWGPPAGVRAPRD